MRAATVVQVLQDLIVLCFIACFILLVIAPLPLTDRHGAIVPGHGGTDCHLVSDDARRRLRSAMEACIDRCCLYRPPWFGQLEDVYHDHQMDFSARSHNPRKLRGKPSRQTPTLRYNYGDSIIEPSALKVDEPP